MVLGTLLGDGCIIVNPSGTGSYQSSHGWKQHEYNLLKHQILQEYTLHPPEKKPNYGYGKWLSIWRTQYLTQFAALHTLIYPKGKKAVTQEWLDLLTPEGITWWVMDDGSLQEGRRMTLSTHGFTKEEVTLLSIWLKEKFKMDVVIYKTLSKITKKPYYIMGFTTKATKILIDLIKPYVPECMSYKISWKSRICRQCGQEMYSSGKTCSRKCSIFYWKEYGKRYFQEHKEEHMKKSAAWGRAHRERTRMWAKKRYYADIEKSRKNGRDYGKIYYQKNPEYFKEKSRKYRDKMKNTLEFKTKAKAAQKKHYLKVRQDPLLWQEQLRKNRLKRRIKIESGPKKTCLFCGKEFLDKRRVQCSSPECAKKLIKKRKQERKLQRSLNPQEFIALNTTDLNLSMI